MFSLREDINFHKYHINFALIFFCVLKNIIYKRKDAETQRFYLNTEKPKRTKCLAARCF